MPCWMEGERVSSLQSLKNTSIMLKLRGERYIKRFVQYVLSIPHDL